MKLESAGCSCRGLVRDVNEDACLMRSAGNAALFLVADGIGGKEHGEIASAMLRDAYDEWFRRFALPGGCSTLPEAIGELRDVLLEQNRELIRRFGVLSCGSTLVLLFLLADHFVIVSSGDSRIYQGRGWNVRQLTVDDVYENLPGRAQEQDSSKRGKLTGAVGICSSPRFSIRTGVLRAGDRFLLCSDGVYRFVRVQALRRALRFGVRSPQARIDRLSAEIESNGAADNYSMICVRIRSL